MCDQPFTCDEDCRVVCEFCMHVHLSVAIVRAYTLPVCVPARKKISNQKDIDRRVD